MNYVVWEVVNSINNSLSVNNPLQQNVADRLGTILFWGCEISATFLEGS